MHENSTPRRPRPGPHSPYVFDIWEQRHSQGSARELRRSVPAPADLGLEFVAVPEGAPMAIELHVEPVIQGVQVDGSITAEFVGECGRCLDPVRQELVAEFSEVFTEGDAFRVDDEDEDAESAQALRLEDDFIDLEAVVRDAVVLALPFTPLCRPDCGGLCPECGQRLDDLPADHVHEQVDPRWAKLSNRLKE